jgi:hypothetical protein
LKHRTPKIAHHGINFDLAFAGLITVVRTTNYPTVSAGFKIVTLESNVNPARRQNLTCLARPTSAVTGARIRRAVIPIVAIVVGLVTHELAQSR